MKYPTRVPPGFCPSEDIGLLKNEQGYGLCRADKGVDRAVEEELLDDPFTLEINVYDLAGDEFVSPGHVVITFRDTDAGTEEIIDLDEVDFTCTDGVKVWQVVQKRILMVRLR